MKIKELQPRTGDAEVEAEVVSISPPRTFNKFGKDGRVANATIKDDSGSMTMTLWNEQIDQVKVGDKIRVTKGWVSEWQGEPQLSTGKFGSLEVLGSSDTSSQPAPKGEDVDEVSEEDF